MIQWYVSVMNLIRSLDKKARDALELYENGGKEASAPINEYMGNDYDQLAALWKQKFPDEHIGNLGRHLHFGQDCDYKDIYSHDLPELATRAEKHLVSSTDGKNDEKVGFEDLLHPIIFKSSYRLYRDGYLREAVLNSITAVFDYLRIKTKSEEDGDRLIGKVMSPQNPIMILSELNSESGRNDQKGFMQIFKGAYQGIRNPKAHSLTHDLTNVKAAQYLIFASLLARRIGEAKIVKI